MFFFFASCNSRTKGAIGALLGRNYYNVTELYSFIELVVKEIIFNIKVLWLTATELCEICYAHALEKWPLASAPKFLGIAQYWHKAYQVWYAMEFLLILFKIDKETFARCLIISGHGNSSPSGKFYPPSFVSSGVQ